MDPKKNVSFDDTSIAFSSKSNRRLRKMYYLFGSMNFNKLVKVGNILITFLLGIRFPIKGLIKHTVFEHFCGGETIEDSEKTIQELGKYNIGTILDYSVEGEKNEHGFDVTAKEIHRTIEKASDTESIPFSVFKVTGIASTHVLTKKQSGIELSQEEHSSYEKVIERVDALCKRAYEKGVRIFIDGEESWIQDVIDDLVYEMMRRYNREKAIVYNTYQMYRHDMLDNLKKAFRKAQSEDYYLGAKLVRGAYLEKERERAEELGYESPIQITKEDTDNDYNRALLFCIENKDRISLCSGSHNEYSNYYLTQLIEEKALSKNDPDIYFAQLYGMSDNISYNLAKSGYNVAKYVPYGPVRSVMPYLIRRAAENSAIAGQTNREFQLIKKELIRRKKGQNGRS
ncbi:proline dehydrogenase family protein [Fulvivirgaceae bacterium BMA10]|uniref:Proline dehydrogenase family protein n=1 Tax=Splendidivirga corallicola TaxID=3051826 RepID=A0ABT8KTM5_9BACT|nr:proline dehydrogenase family protein [Fulvivirgaceae bacterium BMA10]